MKTLRAVGVILILILPIGCGKDEKKDESNPGTPPADKLFDKSKGPAPINNKKEKPNAG